MNAPHHCCDQLRAAVADGELRVRYNPKFREYTLAVAGQSAGDLIHFCPWCGESLPSSVRDQWFDLLEQRLGPDFVDDPDAIPEEFRTDRWWKALGI